MRLLICLAIAGGSQLFVHAQMSYYVDRSCVNTDGFNDAFVSARKMAKRVLERLDSSTDTDFNAVFERVFNVAKSDEGPVKEIKGVYEEIDKMVELVPDVDPENTDETFARLKKADIRFFCDNDAIIKDGEEADYGHPNARWKKKKNSESKYYDFKNHMFADNVPSCHKNTIRKEGDPVFFGRTNHLMAPAPNDPEDPAKDHKDQNKDRKVITICDEVWEDGYVDETKMPTHDNFDFEQAAKNGDFELWHVPLFAAMAAHTILHEMTHAVTSGRVIDEGGSGQAYKWFYVAGHASKGPEQQRINAENYAYLGLFARLADLGYTLRRIHRYEGEEYSWMDADEKRDAWQDLINRAKDGEVVKYDDITKRALRMIARLFHA